MMYHSSLIEEDQVQRYGNIYIILYICVKNKLLVFLNYLFSMLLFFLNRFLILFKTLKLLHSMNIYINIIRNNLRVNKMKMCVACYTNKIWAQKCF